MVQALGDGGQADAEGGGVFEGDVGGEFEVDAGFDFDVLGEGAVGVVGWVAWRESVEDLMVGVVMYLHARSRRFCRLS